MNVHEYQAKALFRSFGVAVPEGLRQTVEGIQGMGYTFVAPTSL